MYVWPWHIRHYSDISEEPMYSYGLYSHGPYSYGLHSYGPCTYGRGMFVLGTCCEFFFVRGTSEGMVQALDVGAFIAAVGTIHGTIYLPSFDTSPTAS